MNQRLLVNLTRQDFGFAVARVLAIVLWVHGAGNLERLVSLVMIEHRYNNTFTTVLTSAPDLVFVAALAYAGYRLWIGASKFGGDGGSHAEGDPMVVASQSLLVSGLAMGVSLYPLGRGLVGCIPYFVELVQSSDGGRPSHSVAAKSLPAALVSLLVGAAIFGWAYNTARKVEVPEFEYTPSDQDG